MFLSPSSVSRRTAGRRIALALAPGVLPAWAQATREYPAKPVRIVTPFPVGSGPEGVLRVIADRLTRTWGVPVTVENRPGGNGFIAIDAFKRASTDGHDLILLDNAHLSAYPHLFKKLPYDAQRDFDPLLPLFKTYFFVAVPVDSPYRTVADLVADARARPGRVNYGSWSVGNPVHLGSALLEAMTSTRMEHVIYKETTQLYTAVSTGELDFALGSSATAGPLQRAGKLRFLAVAAPRRIPAFPDVPTVAEAGGPAGFEVTGLTTIAAPRGLPAAVTDKIRRDVEVALSEPAMRDKYLSFGYELFPQTRQQFAQFLQVESIQSAAIIKKTGASLE